MTVSRRVVTWAQVIGLAVTAYFTWVHALGPRLGRESLVHLLRDTLVYALIAWICAALITVCILITVSLADRSDILRRAARTSAAAMWFAPAIILLSARSAATFTGSLILVVNTTRLLMAQWVPAQAVGKRLRHVLLPAVGGAMVLQAGFVAVLWGYPLLAAALVGCAAAIVTALCLLTGAYRTAGEPRLPLAFLSILLTFVLAIALLPGGGGGQAVEKAAAPKAAMPPVPPRVAEERVRVEQDAAALGPGDFPGVVLLPDLSPQPILVAPPSPSTKLALKTITQPLSFPFSGEYWMFRPPAQRPPARSFLRRGTPLRISFRTVDGSPLEMEARQALARPIDPLCCAKVELLIANGDRYPGLVSLEVVLQDAGGRNSQSLGRAHLGPAARDLLDFAIPSVPSIPQFDQIRVVFHRDPVRVNHSAKIAIERFILVPKGGSGVSPQRQELVAE